MKTEPWWMWFAEKEEVAPLRIALKELSEGKWKSITKWCILESIYYVCYVCHTWSKNLISSGITKDFP